MKLVFNNLFILISHALKCQRCLRLLRLTQIALQIWFGFSSAVSVCIYTYTLIIPSSSWIIFLALDLFLLMSINLPLLQGALLISNLPVEYMCINKIHHSLQSHHVGWALHIKLLRPRRAEMLCAPHPY